MSGKRNKPVAIQRNAESPNPDFVAIPDDWETVFYSWAHIAPATGAETQTSQQNQATVTHVIDIDYPFQEVKPTDRINYEGRIFNIVSVMNPDERDEKMLIRATEIKHDGEE